MGGRKTQLGQGLHWVTSGLGKLRGREAASLRRDLRPTRVEAAVSHSQLHRRHERPAEATDALRPGCRGRDAGRTSTQALRTKRKTHSVPGVQRKKRSTPTAEQVSSGRRAYHSNRRTRPRTKGLITPSIGPRCVRRAYHSALAAFPRGRPFGATRAEGLTPRFLGRETLEKPDNGFIIADRSRGCPGFRGLAAQSVQSSSL